MNQPRYKILKKIKTLFVYSISFVNVFCLKSAPRNHLLFSFPFKRLGLMMVSFSILIFLASCRSSKPISSTEKNEMEEMDEDDFFKEGRKKKRKEEKKEVIKTDDKVKKVIKTARSYIGTPYRYGGTTRTGMDCSGLLCNSFKAINISLPRTSEAQSNYGRKISLDDVEPGDLVFFSERKGGNKVSHVGMVTEVRGKEEVKFIHSSTKLGVVENDLYAPYYIKLFVKAVRPF